MNSRHLTILRLLPILLLGSVLLIACGPKATYFPGTKIVLTEENDGVIQRIEEYRHAVEKGDAGQLLIMASTDYWEDGGSAAGDDDYGYDGLKAVLSRFQLADSIRYSVRYMRIRYKDETVTPSGEVVPRRAFVDVLVDASFSIPDSQGGIRRADKRDQSQFVLEWRDDTWMFLSGM